MAIIAETNEAEGRGPSLRMAVVEKFRSAIMSQRFKPGEKLKEKDLCALTGVSKGVIREVLRHLEVEGLVVNVAGKGPHVARLDSDTAREIYEVRSALEPLAAKLFVARGAPEDAKELQRLAEQYAFAVSHEDTGLLLETLDRFYSLLFDGAGNSTAAEIARTLRFRVHFLRAMTFAGQTPAERDRAVRNIRRIADALASGKGDDAALACADQVARSQTVALRVLSESERTGRSSLPQLDLPEALKSARQTPTPTQTQTETQTETQTTTKRGKLTVGRR